MDISERIKKLRSSNGLTQDELAKKLDVNRSTIAQWESGYTTPRVKMIEKIAAVFRMNASELLDGSSPARYPDNALPVRGMSMTSVPLVGTVHAGKPIDPDYIDDETVQIPSFLVEEDPGCYACVVEGDCMNNVYAEGSVIVVSPNKQPKNGSIAVVRIDGNDAVMRKMYLTKDTLVLSPDSTNPEHEDIVIRLEDDHVIEWGGKVSWHQAREELE